METPQTNTPELGDRLEYRGHLTITDARKTGTDVINFYVDAADKVYEKKISTDPFDDSVGEGPMVASMINAHHIDDIVNIGTIRLSQLSGQNDHTSHMLDLVRQAYNKSLPDHNPGTMLLKEDLGNLSKYIGKEVVMGIAGWEWGDDGTDYTTWEKKGNLVGLRGYKQGDDYVLTHIQLEESKAGSKEVNLYVMRAWNDVVLGLRTSEGKSIIDNRSSWYYYSTVNYEPAPEIVNQLKEGLHASSISVNCVGKTKDLEGHEIIDLKPTIQ